MAEQSHTKKRKRTTIYIRPQHWQMVGEIAAKNRRTKTETLEIAITPDGNSEKLRSVTSPPSGSESPEVTNGNLPNLPTGSCHLYTEITPENTSETTRDYAHGEARPQEQLDVKKIPEEASDNGSAKAVNPDRIDSLNNQDQGQGKFSASPSNQSTEDSSNHEGLILPKEQQRGFWRALTAYIEKTNPKMSRGRAESIASASTERLLNQVPKVQDQEYLDMYRQGILPCYADDRITYQIIKEHQTLEELRGMLYDE